MQQLEFRSGAITPTECIGGGWELVTRRFGMYLGMGLLTILLIGCIPLVSVFLMGPVLAGFYYVVLRDMRNEPVEFGMMFKGFENFVPLMVAGLILSIPGVILTIMQWTFDAARFFGPGAVQRGDFYQASAQDVFFSGISIMFVFVIIGFSLFSIVWQLALQFSIPLIMERNISVGDALALSVRAATSNVGGLIGLILLQILVGTLGVIALCVGVFVAIPVIYAANAFAFRQVFPLIESSFDANPPPPQAYGGGYGGGYGGPSGPVGAP